MQQGACDAPDYFMYDHVCKVSFWHEADKLTALKVRFERKADYGLGYTNGVYLNYIRTIA